MWKPEYESTHGCVTCTGQSAGDGPAFRAFLQGPVSDRLLDTKGHDELMALFDGFELTEMGSEHLKSVLDTDVSEVRDWAIAESIAEATLETAHGVEFPWNHERDKLTPYASLPGADLVGFQFKDGQWRLVLGEVKCSSENKSPPQVMSGRSGGIGHQLDTLAHDLGVVRTLFNWLSHRIKEPHLLDAFGEAGTRYFNSGYKEVVLFGVLVRDLQPNALDLQSRGQALKANLIAPSRCHLLALYLPFPISTLPQAIQPAVPL